MRYANFIQYPITEPSLNFHCQFRIADIAATQLGLELPDWRNEVAHPQFSLVSNPNWTIASRDGLNKRLR
jgi:hypothetical protein